MFKIYRACMHNKMKVSLEIKKEYAIGTYIHIFSKAKIRQVNV